MAAVDVAQLCLVAIAVPLLCTMIFIVISTRLFHNNFRILLVLLCLGFTVYDVCRGTLNVLKLSNAPNTTYWFCVTNVFSYGFYITDKFYTSIFSLIVIERVYATFYVETYEKKCTGPGWAALVIAAAMFAGAIPTAVVMFSENWLLAGTLVVVVVAILQALLATLIYRWNLRLRRRAASLSMKYQVEENLRATSAILPLALTWVGCQILTFVALQYVYTGSPIVAFSVISQLVITIYSVIFPCVLLYAIPKYNGRIRSLLGLRSRLGIVSMDQQTDLYFKGYTNAWGPVERAPPQAPHGKVTSPQRSPPAAPVVLPPQPKKGILKH